MGGYLAAAKGVKDLAGGSGGGGGGGGGGSTGSQTSALFTPTNTPNVPINVAPVGLNLGTIIAPATQGSPENGGSGLDYGRYIPAGYGSNANVGAIQASSNFGFDINSSGTMIVAGLAILAIGYFVLR